jgi:hypothetical protein
MDKETKKKALIGAPVKKCLEKIYANMLIGTARALNAKATRPTKTFIFSVLIAVNIG